LELVHQEEAAPGLCHLPGRRIGEQDLDGPVDLLVEVDGTGLCERGAVSPSRMADRASM
jgi:hypothetical protein